MDICTIQLNRPEALNALNQQMWGEVLAAMQRLAREPQIRVAILTGSGRAFCAGADLKERVWQDASQPQNRARIEANQQQVARAMVAAPMPITDRYTRKAPKTFCGWMNRIDGACVAVLHQRAITSSTKLAGVLGRADKRHPAGSKKRLE